MELFLDFRPPPAGGAAPPAQARWLLGAYQTALGHELPNQLVVVQAFARMLEEQEGPHLSEEGRQLLGRLADTARRVDGLVRRLAEVGRLCRETPAPEAQGPVSSLEEVAREVFAEVNWGAGGDIPARYEVASPLPAVHVPRRALHQVLAELVRNAARAGAPGRHLCVEVGGEGTPAGCSFWVRDNGRGLAEGAPLFEPFAGKGAGAGLGLFLVRQLVAHWGGTLGVHSEPGVGTTFTLFVPCP